MCNPLFLPVTINAGTPGALLGMLRTSYYDYLLHVFGSQIRTLQELQAAGLVERRVWFEYGAGSVRQQYEAVYGAVHIRVASCGVAVLGRAVGGHTVLCGVTPCGRLCTTALVL